MKAVLTAVLLSVTHNDYNAATLMHVLSVKKEDISNGKKTKTKNTFPAL